MRDLPIKYNKKNFFFPNMTLPTNDSRILIIPDLIFSSWKFCLKLSCLIMFRNHSNIGFRICKQQKSLTFIKIITNALLTVKLLYEE